MTPDQLRASYMRDRAKMLTASQRPVSGDSVGAFVLLLILLFAFLPWWKALLCIGLVFGAALPFVLLERQIVFAHNAGRPTWPWHLLVWVVFAVMAAALLCANLWLRGLWP